MSNIYAYDAGYADGQKWVAPHKVPVGTWHDVTIHSIGATAFGLRCGLTDEAIVGRGPAWDAACDEYNRGCVEGVNAQH